MRPREMLYRKVVPPPVRALRPTNRIRIESNPRRPSAVRTAIQEVYGAQRHSGIQAFGRSGGEGSGFGVQGRACGRSGVRASGLGSMGFAVGGGRTPPPGGEGERDTPSDGTDTFHPPVLAAPSSRPLGQMLRIWFFQ